MKLVTKEIYEHTIIEEYTPTAYELHYWYSGTRAGLDPNNPYAPRRSTRITKTKMRRLK